MGWLPALACSRGASSWTDSVENIADARLENYLGSYSESICREWVVSDRFLADLACSGISDDPDVWTDGSYVVDELSRVGVGGCGGYSHRSGLDVDGGHLDLLPPCWNLKRMIS